MGRKLDAPIVIDTREQRPYQIDDAIRAKLDAGDYSVEGYESRIAIERKSLDDWIGTILRNRERFARELARLSAYDFAAVVVEGTVADIAYGLYKSEIKPSALIAMTADLIIRLRPIAVMFGGDRPSSAALTIALLRQAVNHCEELDLVRLNDRELETLREVMV